MFEKNRFALLKMIKQATKKKRKKKNTKFQVNDSFVLG